MENRERAIGNLVLPDIYFAGLWSRVPNQVRVTFFATFIAGLLIHLFKLANNLPNHDGMAQIFDSMSRPGSGRWFLSPVVALGSNFSMPWVNGMLTILFISLSACFVVSCLRIQRPFLGALLGVIMVAFPTVAATMTYMSSTAAYFFSLLLVCAAAWLFRVHKFGAVFAIPLIVLSMGIYQAYLGVVAALAVILLLIDILKRQSTNHAVLIKSFIFLGSLGMSVMLYLFITRIFFGSQLVEYMGMNEMGVVALSEIPSLIFRAYGYAAVILFNNHFYFHWPIMRYAFLILTIATIALIALLVIRKKIYKDAYSMCLLVLFLAILPLAANIVYVQVAHALPHLLMVYGLVMLFAAAIAVVDIAASITWSKRMSVIVFASFWVVVIVGFMSVYNYSIVTNRSYFALHMTYEQGYARSVALVTKIQQIEGYTSNDKIYFLGIPDPIASVNAPDLIGMTGVIKDIPSTWHYIGFLRHYLGFQNEITALDITCTETSDFLQDTHDIDLLQFPVYPNDGSIARVNNLIFVRFE